MYSNNPDSVFCVAYNDSGFVPSDPSLHFLADGGNSFSPEEYSFTAPAQKSFTVVIHAVKDGGAVGTLYNPNVSLSECSIVYTFTGNGNWNNSNNWLNGIIPPANLQAGAEILIDPVPTGECVLNVAQTVSAGGIITVQAGKKFRIAGNLSISN